MVALQFPVVPVSTDRLRNEPRSKSTIMPSIPNHHSVHGSTYALNSWSEKCSKKREQDLHQSPLSRLDMLDRQHVAVRLKRFKKSFRSSVSCSGNVARFSRFVRKQRTVRFKKSLPLDDNGKGLNLSESVCKRPVELPPGPP